MFNLNSNSFLLLLVRHLLLLARHLLLLSHADCWYKGVNREARLAEAYQQILAHSDVERPVQSVKLKAA